jgi:hypothetical protein
MENRGRRANSLDKTAMNLYFEESAKLRESKTKTNKELEAALDHWINNPLISPVSKVKLYEEDLAVERKGSVKELTEIVKTEIAKLELQLAGSKNKKDKQAILLQVEGLKAAYNLIIDNLSSSN